jgi:excisionase family DNA binding protein
LKSEAVHHFLTADEAASLLRVEVGTIRNGVSQNKIPYRKAGATILFLLEEILEWTLPPTRMQKASGLVAVE